ncbi:prolipoprotein diacylglyceryl transferase [Culicoidibacter larvae]|uniref:Phosphatidylglycerol--prolipoprotein diacylglyceryl transferase n=1 Tax=Culicoidibacter larvae TaxID=2579976 RepID=A0A5R8QIL2_9FIRM|nr:prolipoprotein diacylglyceryl transferase [Culicoidibacter larvae]TLG77520.1 prolipoprotein diacylglyceryl transferase [Culicoidibacter larvae]
MSNPALDLGIFKIHWYAIIIVVGAIIGLFFAYREAKRFKVSLDTVMDLFLYIFIAGIIGARIYYVVFEWQQFASDPMKVFAIWNGGLAIYGGIIGGGIAGLVYCYVKKVNFWLFTDIAMPSVLLAQAVGRWGNFVNIEAYGGIVPGIDLAAQHDFLKGLFLPDFIIDRMLINGAYHHPTFLYESIWSVIGVLIIFLILRRWKGLLLGEITAFYFIWYGIGRFFIEGMRTDSLYIFDTFRVSQLLSLLLIAVALGIVIWRRVARKYMTPYREAKPYLGITNEAEETAHV